MPLNWKDGTADKKLIALLLEQIPRPDLKRIAEAMGDGVTAKAISHRIDVHKTGAAGLIIPTTPAKATPAKPKAKRTKASPKTPSKATPKKRSAKEMESSSSIEEESEVTDWSALDGEESASSNPGKQTKGKEAEGATTPIKKEEESESEDLA